MMERTPLTPVQDNVDSAENRRSLPSNAGISGTSFREFVKSAQEKRRSLPSNAGPAETSFREFVKSTHCRKNYTKRSYLGAKRKQDGAERARQFRKRQKEKGATKMPLKNVQLLLFSYNRKGRRCR